MNAARWWFGCRLFYIEMQNKKNKKIVESFSQRYHQSPNDNYVFLCCFVHSDCPRFFVVCVYGWCEIGVLPKTLALSLSLSRTLKAICIFLHVVCHNWFVWFVCFLALGVCGDCGMTLTKVWWVFVLVLTENHLPDKAKRKGRTADDSWERVQSRDICWLVSTTIISQKERVCAGGRTGNAI